MDRSNGSLASKAHALTVPPLPVIFGRTNEMTLVQRRIEKLALANIPVLIEGESGTGKEIIAKLLHSHSPWSSGAFVRVNCPAIPGTLMESELFGYERGAFTGAYGVKPGRVEMAQRGTLFLDEIGEMDLGLQSKLLQVLQDGQFCRIGSQEEKRLEARVVCATNRTLDDEIAAGTFRHDLYYRINVGNVSLPPLRKRIDDIPDLAEYFVQFYSSAFGRAAVSLPRSVIRSMMSYSWPGNIRELENLVKRYVILGSPDVITTEIVFNKDHQRTNEDDWDGDIPTDGSSISLKEVTRRTVRRVERKLILKVLKENLWNRKKSARVLNISYRALLYKLKETGLQSDDLSEVALTAPLGSGLQEAESTES